MVDLRKCSRCHSTKLEKYFSINVKGELYKLCDNCGSSKNKSKKEIQTDSRKCLYCGNMFCDDAINPKTNKLYETCENHRGFSKEVCEGLKIERQKIKDEKTKQLWEHFKNRPINNVLRSAIVDTYSKLLEWINDDNIIVRHTNIIDEDHVEVVYANKEDEIEAELYINKDFYEMKWGRHTL